MIAVSEAWKEKHKQFLLPETFVEISCVITDSNVQEEAVPSATQEDYFSSTGLITIAEPKTRYATLESNLWLLDETRDIIHDEAPYTNTGYASGISQLGSATLTLPGVRTTAIPGVTIVWANEFGEYAKSFTITAKNGDAVVAETTITNNTSAKTLVYLDISNYNSVTVTINEWCIPGRRARIDYFLLGLDMTFDKNDLLSYTHEQHGCLVSGELPKNSIEFSINNIDSMWNPNNPEGMARYLIERQKLTVRYGMDIDGVTEWINGGTFYLSEWYAPSNGIEASFKARDMFEFLLDVGGVGASMNGTLTDVVNFSTESYLPEDVTVVVDPLLDTFTKVSYLGSTTHAESVQKCANAAGCVLRPNRSNALYIEPLNTTMTDYVISLDTAYAYPEVELSKQMASISVSYKDSENDTPYVLDVSNVGEKQTVDNDYIITEEQATLVAGVVRDMLESRKTISGEFRADPRLDLFDIVTVETKFGEIAPVAIATIKYTYSGSFKASYVGRVLSGTTAAAINA